MSQIFVILSGAVHVYIFFMESILWGKPRINRVFGVSPEQAEHNRLLAFNQGYYNLFLAVAALSGVAFVVADQRVIGLTLMIYSSLSMIGAAIALFCSQRRLIRAALVQGLPPLIGLIFLALH